ncbi:phospholipase C/P1 nuclease [Wilcoxina mikolae CBS 423.85]|nr:phospholipase C/P1 nuclease [Wilcoxina mikolae CBS 423.85]
MHTPLPHLLLLLTLLTPAWSWGMLGHRTTALLAARFLSRDAARQIRQLLKPQSLVTASTWADYYAHTPFGRYSAPWHWIDARDSPPHACGVEFSRDCTSQGCIVSAIANHTERVVDISLDWQERSMSLKWVVHFLGDIHQPLHTENLLRGGNSIGVVFDGKHTNLHHVWDSSIAETLIGGNTIRDAVGWANTLYERIDEGKWGNVTEKWGGCLDTTRAEECALSWASETNTWMCKYVLPETYPEGFVGSELNGSYYQGAVEIVETQVAIAGWRMGMWLNAIFEGKNVVEESSRDKSERHLGLAEEL